jgi:spore maturation protein CgeB
MNQQSERIINTNPKILFVSPISIAGALIIKGFARGFEDLGFRTIFLDVRELDYDVIKDFVPELIIGYDYSHLINPVSKAVIDRFDVPKIHYFADNPNDNFSLSGDNSLPEKLALTKGKVFCWDKNYLNEFKNEAFYLPLAVNPEDYASSPLRTKEHGILFAGRPLTERRINILCEIVRNFPDKLSIYSFKKHFDRSVDEIREQNLLSIEQLESYINSYKGFLNTEKELAAVYSNSKIVLNITMEQGLSSMNYRVLEVLASRGFLVTDYKEDTAEYFESDKELVFYKNNSDLTEKIKKYLENETLRDEISDNGKNKVLKFHTFKQRAREMLDLLGNRLAG